MQPIKKVACEYSERFYIGNYVEEGEEGAHLCYEDLAERGAVLLCMNEAEMSFLAPFTSNEQEDLANNYYIYQYIEAISYMKHMLGKSHSLSTLQEILAYLKTVEFPRIEYMPFSRGMWKEHENCIRETTERINRIEEQGAFMRSAFCYKETCVYALVPDVVTLIWKKLQE